MADATEKLNEIVESADGRIERLVSLALEAEVDHRQAEALRVEIKKWVDSIKADSLIHFALHMVGEGYKFYYDLNDKLTTAGQDIEPEKKIQYTKGLEEAHQRVTTIAKLALDAERNNQTAENLRDNIKQWMDGVSPDVLLHFASHMIGTGYVFSEFVRQKTGDKR